MGRPTDWSPEVEKIICDVLREGCPRTTAAGCAGIHIDTFYEWIARGKREPDSDYSRFSDAVEKAVHTGARDLCKRVHGGDPGWQGSSWLLERCQHEAFARRLHPADAAVGADVARTIVELVSKRTT